LYVEIDDIRGGGGRARGGIRTPKRRHATIGDMSPMEFERQAGLA
jgi:hypothetical protein